MHRKRALPQHYIYLLGLLAFCTLTFPSLSVAAAGIVEIVRAPAWLVRDQNRQPLVVGTELRSSDTVETGPGSRVLIRLEEGSMVKLGESAVLDLERLVEPAAPDGVFEGLLRVARGAFRFTTTALGNARRRDVTATIATVTIGIRGTDVWGKAEPTRDFVVLLEGTITVDRDGIETTMADPLTLFMAPTGQPALPVGPVDQNDLAVWAQETEPQADSGVQNGTGNWRVNLASFREGADAFVGRLAQDGYAALTESVTVDGTAWTRVAATGFAERGDAADYAARLTSEYALDSPWLERR